MLFYLFLLFTVVPLVELTLLLWIGEHTHWWVPVLMVVTTAMLGAALARWQGWQVLRRIQDEMRAGHMPADALVDGAMILVAGVLLVTPGVMTDVVGIVLLVPPLRHVIKRGLKAWLKSHVVVEGVRVETSSTDGQGGDAVVDAQVIETRVDDVERGE